MFCKEIVCLIIIFISIFTSADIRAEACFSEHAEIDETNIFSFVDLQIKIDTNFRKYQKKILSALVDEDQLISDQIKKYQRATITFKTRGQECEVEAKIRLTGDYKDHIDKKTLTSSLKVKIKDRAIGGITKFKLLNPDSRFGINEVYAAGLFRALGYISPRTIFAKVNIGNVSRIFIFQEELKKEMVEFHNLREDIIFKGSEEIRKRFGSNLAIWEVDNLKYLKKNNRERAAYRGQSHLQKYFGLNSFGFESYVQNTSESKILNLAEYIILLAAIEGGHSTVFDNIHLYFDSMNDRFIPIYYDGNVRIDQFGSQFFISDALLRQLANLMSSHQWESLYKKIDIMISGSENSNEYDFLDRYIELHDEVGTNKSPIEFLKKLSSNLRNIQDYSRLSSGKYNSPKSQAPPISCCVIAEKTLDEVLGDSLPFFSADFSPASDRYGSDSEKINIFVPQNIDFISRNAQANYKYLDLKDGVYAKIYGFNEHFDTLSSRDKDLTIFCRFCQTQLGGVINDYSITVTYPPVFDENVVLSRKDKIVNSEFNLSGAVTILDSRLDNVLINVSHSPWEDAFNCIRCNGNISSAIISGGVGDGVDVDVSNLIIDSVSVIEAGNDCVDFSGGVNVINNFFLKGCGDKGISLGEKGVLKISSGEISDAAFGLAVKDSSQIYIYEDEEASLVFNETSEMFFEGNKKQEYGFGSIKFIQSR